MLKLYLSFNIFWNIWEDSNKEFRKNKILSFYENKLFTIESNNNKLFTIEFIKKVFNDEIKEKDKSNILKIVEEAKYITNNNQDIYEIEYKLNFIALYMVNSNKILIDILYKLNYDNIILNDISNILDKIYLKLLLIIKNLKRNKKDTNIDELIKLINIFEEKVKLIFI